MGGLFDPNMGAKGPSSQNFPAVRALGGVSAPLLPPILDPFLNVRTRRFLGRVATRSPRKPMKQLTAAWVFVLTLEYNTN